MMLRIPTATYRLQFNAQFTFADARKIVPYLADLGITDVYVSPILRARKGSMHGYDTVDASMLNPELGTEEDFTELCVELDRRNMGLVLDIVPNHMAVSHENAWWNSLLENGPQSRFAHYFDIDWRDDKVLLPILGRPYGETLESNEIRLEFDAEGFFFTYYDKRLPLAPQSYPLILRDCVDAVPVEGVGVELRDLAQQDGAVANSRFLKETLARIYEDSLDFRAALDGAVAGINQDVDRLDQLLAAQYYRLAYWRIASETINYRRFFDVTDLVGIRVENPEVFEARNRRILDLIAERKVTGLRVDHIDGLYDPAAYLTRLQHRLGEPMYIIVEKILARDETLPPSFACAGTTGYDFLDCANALFVDPDGVARLTELYRTYTGVTTSFEDLVYERKKQVIDQLFSGEMRALGQHLGALAVADRNARDFAPSELLVALVEATACLPVYRTYIRSDEMSQWDHAIVGRAIGEARRRAGDRLDARLFDFLQRVLHLDPPPYISDEREKWADFVMRWQQFTPRVLAKGVEDTSFYVYNRLVSLNEVGGEPGRIEGDPVAALHARNERIARDWPHTMNATSTHDTKRSEDVRARIDVLSELAEEWQREVRKWTRMNGPLKRDGAPEANEELLIYQTLAGAWPITADRLTLYLEKAVREAKTHSSWLSPNVAYESALREFAAGILEHAPFVKAFERFHRRIAFHGFLNALAQVVVKIFSPGVPDFYQGTELWDFSLVDPDNRRPVDYDLRAQFLRRLGNPATLSTIAGEPPPGGAAGFSPPDEAQHRRAEARRSTGSKRPGSARAMLRNWKDGRVKLFVSTRSLAARARHADGAYRAVDTGTENAVAFMRGHDLLVVVPRLTTRLVKAPQLPLGNVWGEQTIDVAGRWRNVFTDEVIEGAPLALRDVFGSFPVAVLEALPVGDGAAND